MRVSFSTLLRFHKQLKLLADNGNILRKFKSAGSIFVPVELLVNLAPVGKASVALALAESMMRTYVTKRNNVDLCCSDNADRLISGVQYDAVFSLRRNRLIIDFVKLLGGSRARFYAAQHKFGKLVRCVTELPCLVFIMFDAVFLGKFAPKLLCCHIFTFFLMQ